MHKPIAHNPGRGPCVGNHLSQAAKHRAPASSGIPAASCRGPPSQGWPNSRKLRNLKKLGWQHQSGGRPRARTAAPWHHRHSDDTSNESCCASGAEAAAAAVVMASSTMIREPLWTSQNTGATRARLRMYTTELGPLPVAYCAQPGSWPMCRQSPQPGREAQSSRDACQRYAPLCRSQSPLTRCARPQGPLRQLGLSLSCISSTCS